MSCTCLNVGRNSTSHSHPDLLPNSYDISHCLNSQTESFHMGQSIDYINDLKCSHTLKCIVLRSENEESLRKIPTMPYPYERRVHVED
ncbi:hypothetical protein L9F63_007740, partial [Diploptera punctata]